MIFRPDGRPEITAQARAWGRRKLKEVLASFAPPQSDDDREWRARVLEACVERLEEFVSWKSGDEFDPDMEHEDGRWCFPDLATAKARMNAIASRLADSQSYPTLEEWLTALHAGEVRDAGPSEPWGGSYLEGNEAQSAFFWAAIDRRRAWPRLCKVCGDEFRPEQRSNQRRCRPCITRAGGYAPRPRPCAECGAAFTALHPSRRYCDPCRARRAEGAS